MALICRVGASVARAEHTEFLFNLNAQGLDDEKFTDGMRDNVLQNSLSFLFGLLVAILVSYVCCLINKLTLMVASLGEARTRRPQKGVCMVAKKALAARKDRPLKVMQTQTLVDLVFPREDQDKMNGKPIAYLLEL